MKQRESLKKQQVSNIQDPAAGLKQACLRPRAAQQQRSPDTLPENV
ncbi:MAG: hypothetical protein NW241_14760 [Bacteroidia bacterium]|nr:hypothetical protein [Bacteroidia bacterium]